MAWSLVKEAAVQLGFPRIFTTAQPASISSCVEGPLHFTARGWDMWQCLGPSHPKLGRAPTFPPHWAGSTVLSGSRLDTPHGVWNLLARTLPPSGLRIPWQGLSRDISLQREPQRKVPPRLYHPSISSLVVLGEGSVT